MSPVTVPTHWIYRVWTDGNRSEVVRRPAYNAVLR